jgi:hypothetical protein
MAVDLSVLSFMCDEERKSPWPAFGVGSLVKVLAPAESSNAPIEDFFASDQLALLQRNPHLSTLPQTDSCIRAGS